MRWLLLVGFVVAGCGDDSASDAGADSGPDSATDASSDSGVDAPDPDAPAPDAPMPDSSVDADVPDERIGWAFESGLGLETTTGGGDLDPVVVTTLEQLEDAVAGDTPAVIQIEGAIEGTVRFGSNKTVTGAPGSVFTGSFVISDQENVILQDLTLVGYNCSDNPDCGDGRDMITVFETHHVWIDHCDISDGSDGNLDITAGSDFVTVSWTRFSYSGRRDHQLSNLVGASNDAPEDVGRLNVTWHHNHWADNVNSRMPRIRYGRNHIFNNLYTSEDNSYCIGLGVFGDVLVENNVFIRVDDPINTTQYSNDESKLEARGNLFTEVTGQRDGFGSGVFTPPYAYSLQDTATVEATVRAGVGPR